MIPKPGQTLIDLATRLATHVVPDVNTNFGQADSGLISGLLITLGQEFERSVDNAMQDIDELKVLFATLDENIPGHAERDRFRETALSSLHLTDVTQLQASGLECLIALHEWAESNDEALDVTIWQFLRRHTERGKFDFPGP